MPANPELGPKSEPVAGAAAPLGPLWAQSGRSRTGAGSAFGWAGVVVLDASLPASPAASGLPVAEAVARRSPVSHSGRSVPP